MTQHNRSCAAWYRQLLREREGVNGCAREVAVLRFLLGGDDLDRYISRRSLTDGEFAVAMNHKGK